MMLITPTAETYVAISRGSVSLANATLLTLARACSAWARKICGHTTGLAGSLYRRELLPRRLGHFATGKSGLGGQQLN